MSFYRMLEYSHMDIKVSEIITDHQVVFSENIGDRDINHYDLMEEIGFRIYPSLTSIEKRERRDENVHIFLNGFDAYINFPENGKISLPQYSMMIDSIKEISDYNREVPTTEKISIRINDPIRTMLIYDINELDEEILKEWKKYLRPTKEIDREEIVGEEYSSDISKKKS